MAGSAPTLAELAERAPVVAALVRLLASEPVPAPAHVGAAVPAGRQIRCPGCEAVASNAAVGAWRVFFGVDHADPAAMLVFCPRCARELSDHEEED